MTRYEHTSGVRTCVQTNQSYLLSCFMLFLALLSNKLILNAVRATVNVTMEESFKVLRDQGKSELLEILDSLRGRKCLVLEPSIMRLLSEILFEGDQQLMKDNNVHQCDINVPNLSAVFDSGVGYDLPDNICYLVRPNFAMMKTVSRHIRECVKSGENL